jgi:hypothetical protein
MDLHPYDIVHHYTKCHDNYHARMHGLIHVAGYGHANHAF